MYTGSKATTTSIHPLLVMIVFLMLTSLACLETTITEPAPESAETAILEENPAGAVFDPSIWTPSPTAALATNSDTEATPQTARPSSKGKGCLAGACP